MRSSAVLTTNPHARSAHPGYLLLPAPLPGGCGPRSARNRRRSAGPPPPQPTQRDLRQVGRSPHEALGQARRSSHGTIVAKAASTTTSPAQTAGLARKAAACVATRSPPRRTSDYGSTGTGLCAAGTRAWARPPAPSPAAPPGSGLRTPTPSASRPPPATAAPRPARGAGPVQAAQHDRPAAHSSRSTAALSATPPRRASNRAGPPPLVCVSPTRASHGPARGSRRHGRRRTCAGRFNVTSGTAAED